MACRVPPRHRQDDDDRPELVIQPTSGWAALKLGDMWRYRDLFYFLVWRDVKVRYKQTVLGAAWAIIQPLFSMVVFTLFFGNLARIPSDGFPYAIFSLCATVPWTFFSNSLSTASNSLVGSASLISKVYFPRMIVPASAAVAGLVDFAIAFVVLVGMMLAFGVTPNLGIVTIPLLVLLCLGLSLGVGLWLSALNVQYRDVQFTIPFLLQLWMFATPIVYPLSMVPQQYQIVISLNPMVGIIEGFRSALLGSPWPAGSLAISVGCSLAIIISGSYYFKRVERSLADII